MMLVYTVGLPASGKTTWAKSRQDMHGMIRVNKDDLRAMLFGDKTKWNPNLEKIVDKAELAAVEQALKGGRSVVVDATNLSESRKSKWEEVAKQNKAFFSAKDFTDVPLRECLLRDMQRGNKVGAQAIIDMAKKNGLMPPIQEDIGVFQSRHKSRAIICDIDGTVAQMVDRSPYDYSKVLSDEPNRPVVNLVNMMGAAGYQVIFCSGRPDSCRKDTQEWLGRYFDNFRLHMRKTEDERPDWEVKMEIFEKEISPEFYVETVFDDRDQVVALWRSLGLTCLQVGYGNF